MGFVVVVVCADTCRRRDLEVSRSSCSSSLKCNRCNATSHRVVIALNLLNDRGILCSSDMLHNKVHHLVTCDDK